VGKVIHGECGLERVLSALMVILELRAGIEYEPVYAHTQISARGTA
jgi:hypothetical protein